MQEGNLSYQQMAEDHNELERKTTRLEEIIAAFESINYSLQFENDSLKRNALLHENLKNKCTNFNPTTQRCTQCDKQFHCVNEYCANYYHNHFDNCECINTFCTYCNIRKRKKFFPDNEIEQTNRQEQQSSHEAEVAAAQQLATYRALMDQEQINNSNANQLNQQQTLAVPHQHIDIIADHNNQNM